MPNGAAGLALLAKICKKSNRKDQAIHFFRMSLQLDPFLFTSFQALAELGVVDLDATAIFGGGGGSSSAALATQIHPPPHTNNNNKTTTVVKTPLQPMELLAVSTAARNNDNRGAAHFIDTPGLTPIPYNNQNHSTPVPLSMGLSSTTAATAPGTSQQPSIVRRARHIASRQHYPPTIHDTPLTSVTRSMRYLRGLGTHDVGRSLFLASLENHHAAPNSNSEAPIPPATTNVQTLVTTTNATAEGVSCAKADKESNEVVQDILDLLTIAGAAYLHLCQYRCQEALHLFQQLSFSQQQTAWVLNQQGRAFLEKGDFLAAQRCLECMHAVDPGRMQGLELLSTVYWQLKKEIDLANLAQRAMDWDFSSPQAFCVAGNCFSLQKDHENALVFFKRSLQLDPHFTYTHTLAGYEYMSNEDFDKAFACFRKAIQLDDRHYNAWYGLGAVYHRQEKYDLAEYHFDRAVSIHPTSSVLRCNLGMAQNANGKAYVALETLSEAFRLDPRNPQARFQRATIYSALHRPEEALAELKIVRDAAPREATVHFAMGKVLKRLGRPDEAMKCFLTAMDLDPKDNQLIKSAMDKLDEPDADEESTTNY